jgi:Ca2+-binding RTX toxin-like protein
LIGNDAGNQMTGGDGADQFWLSTHSDPDIITDFSSQLDRFVLNRLDFGAFGQSFDADEFFMGAASADSNDFLVYNQANGFLLYDQDGSGSARSPLHLATLLNKPALLASDFLLV